VCNEAVLLVMKEIRETLKFLRLVFLKFCGCKRFEAWECQAKQCALNVVNTKELWGNIRYAPVRSSTCCLSMNHFLNLWGLIEEVENE
jgi:hypothetical protein